MSSPIRKIAKTSDWLRRLRASKGFPDTDDTDLEGFLSRLYKQVDAMALLRWNVKRRRTVKKVNRDLRTALIPLARTLKRKRSVRKLNREIKSGERVKVEQKCDLDISGSSKTEVTIIDTSNQSWISEKTYRRKNIWEVGDKKGKSLMSGDKLNTNKTLNDNGDGDIQKKKFQLCSSSKSWAAAEHGNIKKKRGQLCNSSESAQGHEQGTAVVAAFKLKRDNCSQAL